MSKESARAAVLDVGCFSAHLVVVEQERGLRRPVLSHKVRLRLDDAMDPSGRIERAGIERIADAVAETTERLGDARPTLFVPYATSCVRDSANVGQVVATVAERTGLRLRLLSGEREAQLSYVAAWRWFQPDGPLAVLDVGGGTVELAVGRTARPGFTRSLPIGARTLNRAGLDSRDQIPALRDHLLRRIDNALPDDVLAEFRLGHAVGCSKVFRQLAKLAGSRRLCRADLETWIPRLAELPPDRRAELRGISRHRARQSLAGAVVADALMRATGHDVIDISPWSTKEGLLLTLLCQLRDRDVAP
ncbi:Ppx/GppA phosphatase family protein [Actinophytocola gossypii]|uniref:Exopolyphosphatase n=1 Tax=Actinophytocola gossypii TaxID=2812003 RepID=A0ABT2J950_9PSEU|nr:exopolyphosphatase [Actinophytocola gossypii]MCT2584392.1 exopolyphosphatase [Actinophytocola gossypii]